MLKLVHRVYIHTNILVSIAISVESDVLLCHANVDGTTAAQYINSNSVLQYKYQVSLDGTVAAYRFPYLLGGSGVVLKQDSPYYEHFYNQLKPYVHYLPFKRDLSDLVDKVTTINKTYFIQLSTDKLHPIFRSKHVASFSLIWR